MASYMHNPMFGQDYSQESNYSLSSGVGFDYSSEAPATPPITTGSEGDGGVSGTGSVANWLNVGAQALNLGAQIYNAATGTPNVAATPIPVAAQVPAMAHPAVPSSGSSPLLLIGALAVGAYLLMK